MLRSGLPEPLAQHPAAGVPLLLATIKENKQEKNSSERPEALRTKPPLQPVDLAIRAGRRLHQRPPGRRFACSSLPPAQALSRPDLPPLEPQNHTLLQCQCQSPSTKIGGAPTLRHTNPLPDKILACPCLCAGVEPTPQSAGTMSFSLPNPPTATTDACNHHHGHGQE